MESLIRYFLGALMILSFVLGGIFMIEEMRRGWNSQWQDINLIHGNQTYERALEHFFAEVDAFSGGQAQEDDQTMVVLRAADAVPLDGVSSNG